MSHPRTLAQAPARTGVARGAAWPLLALACLLMHTPAGWARIKAETVTLDYQVRNSDVVLRGTCAATTTGWNNKHLVTTYKIVVNKYLKAPGKMSVATHPVIFVSQLGGRVSSPLPLEESYPEMAAISQGEEVVLFLVAPESTPASLRMKYDALVQQGKVKPSPLMTNYRLTTLNISKMSVATDPKTGVPRVTHGVPMGVRATVPAAAPAPASALPVAGTMEQRIAHLANFNDTWDVFQQQVNGILNSPPTAPAPISGPGGAASSPRAIRQVQPR